MMSLKLQQQWLTLCIIALAVAPGFGTELPSITSRKIEGTSLRIELRESAAGAVFALVGSTQLDKLRDLTARELSERFKIQVVDRRASNSGEDSVASDTPALLGEYSIVNSELTFTPRFPLNANVDYRVSIAESLTEKKPGKSYSAVIASRAKPKKEPAKIVAVYPTASELPENLLKFYIHFSQPMSRGEAYERIHLMQGDTEVEAPFLELGEELWNTEQTRFTLLVHPGRIKRGVKPREDTGLPMADGKAYTLKIDADWLSADRQPLAAAFEKKFRAVAADDQQPNQEYWKIAAPKVGTSEPVTLTFNESLDHGMLSRVLAVQDLLQLAVEGDVTVAEGEKQWLFEPHEPWKAGVYTIVIATNLEDLCGNSLARPFETTLQPDGVVTNQRPFIAIEFVVE